MTSDVHPLADLVAESRRIVAAAERAPLRIRVLGGVGVALHDHINVPPALQRLFGDIDIVVPAKATKPTSQVLGRLGYLPNERFNALHGAKRMLFYDNSNGRQLDVFVGAFAMCHHLDLTKQLDVHPQALGAADLLLTKLQIQEINHKDIIDAVRLILSHEMTDTTPAAANVDLPYDSLVLDRLREVTSSDWGWYTTFTDNLAQVRGAAIRILDPGDGARVVDRIDRIDAALQSAPKSMRWRTRSVIGRKTPWYELPEEVDRGTAP